MGRLREIGKRLTSSCKPLYAALYSIRRIQQRFLLRLAALNHPIDPKLAMFDAYQSRHYCGNPKALYLELMQNPAYEAYHCVWVLRDPESMPDGPDGPRTAVVRYDSPAYRQALVCARYIVTNSMMPPFYKIRRGQSLIQTWHGTPLKRLGCDLQVDANAFDSVRDIHRRYRAQARQFTWLLSPSPFCSEKLSTAFDLRALSKEDILIEEGYPRNDRLFQWTEEQARAIRRKLGIPPDKKVILYAPTFRDNQRKDREYVYTPGLDFSQAAEALGEDVVWLFRAHYFIAEHMDFERFGGRVLDVSGVEDINELYIISDLLVTDYSSVFFDYANLRRPIVFYMYDREDYQHHLRDFYLDLSELPGPVVQDEESLYAVIRDQLDYFSMDEHYEAFCETFTGKDDGHASRRVWETIFCRENGGEC